MLVAFGGSFVAALSLQWIVLRVNGCHLIRPSSKFAFEFQPMRGSERHGCKEAAQIAQLSETGCDLVEGKSEDLSFAKA